MRYWAAIAVYCAGSVWAQTILKSELERFDSWIAEGNYEKALAPLEALVAAHPELAEAQYQLGYVYYRLHWIAQSVKALSASLAINSRNADAHRILGYDLTILGRLDLAETEFRRAIELKPQSAESHYALGRVHYEKGSYAAAAAEFEQALRINPSYGKAHENLGLAYEAVNEIAQARAHFETAVRLAESEPQPSPWPYINFAGFQNRRGDYAAALQFARRALAIAPRSDAARFQSAKALRGLERWNECIQELQEAIAINSNNPEFFYTLAVAYRRLGQPDRARVSMEQFEKLKQWEATAPKSLPGGELE